MELNDVLQPVGEMIYSKAELLVPIVGKKPFVWGKPEELQIQVLLLVGIFQCQEERFLLSALAIDE